MTYKICVIHLLLISEAKLVKLDIDLSSLQGLEVIQAGFGLEV